MVRVGRGSSVDQSQLDRQDPSNPGETQNDPRNAETPLKLDQTESNPKTRKMIAPTSTSGWFVAKTVVAASILLVALSVQTSSAIEDGCKIECYPNSKPNNVKGAPGGKNDNCRWILRTDGKPYKLCEGASHIKCTKVCPSGVQATGSSDQLEAASSPTSDMRIEQQLEGAANSNGQPMGIMRHLHGGKMAKAPVPGVAGGRISPSASNGTPSSSGGLRMAPTLPPSVQYDENDTPPPIARFLDISPEE